MQQAVVFAVHFVGVMMVDYCVICGTYVPEGRQVCGLCERMVGDGEEMDKGRERVPGTELPEEERTGTCESTGQNGIEHI